MTSEHPYPQLTNEGEEVLKEGLTAMQVVEMVRLAQHVKALTYVKEYMLARLPAKIREIITPSSTVAGIQVGRVYDLDDQEAGMFAIALSTQLTVRLVYEDEAQIAEEADRLGIPYNSPIEDLPETTRALLDHEEQVIAVGAPQTYIGTVPEDHIPALHAARVLGVIMANALFDSRSSQGIDSSQLHRKMIFGVTQVAAQRDTGIFPSLYSHGMRDRLAQRYRRPSL